MARLSKSSVFIQFLTICLVSLVLTNWYNVIGDPEVSTSAKRHRRHRSDRAKLIRQYLKKNGRLEGMIRLADSTDPHQGTFHRHLALH